MSEGLCSSTHFQDLLVRLSLSPDEQQYERLVRAYQDESRHYHNLAHIEDCLTHFKLVKHVALRPNEVELAIWFHDVVYDARRNDNEAMSAEWAEIFLHGHAAVTSLIQRVHELIMTTKTHTPETHDQACIVDVDLAILAADEDRFEAYERAIRKEYAWVEEDAYLAGRGKVLRSFLARDRIYHLPEMHDTYEIKARQNLCRLLDTTYAEH